MKKSFRLTVNLLIALSSFSASALTMDEAIAGMTPYTGAHTPGVDTSTMDGKVLCGYQGWFAIKGDPIGIPGSRYFVGNSEPTFDIWPDMSEMNVDEKYAVPFKHADGSPAYLFSSGNAKTVNRHFKWMKDHGIDGVFLQRFAGDTASPDSLKHRNIVTANVQAAANHHGRTWAMMYDLSGLGGDSMKRVVHEDWKRLVDRTQLRKDKSYLHHNGKPVVAVWGIGFPGRAYKLKECMELLKFLKDDPVYGGNTIMVGVPYYWRELGQDTIDDPFLHQVIKQADIVSPWSVGRIKTPEAATEAATTYAANDLKWCQDNDLEYLRVIFPGFSWHNLMKKRRKNPKLNAIPRHGGQFIWNQAVGVKKVGANMLYVAMYDEIDEGTAIFKCTNNPPVGDHSFITYEGLPSDHYLWLTGQIGKMLRGEIPANKELPPLRQEK